jgi:mannose-6-phosphate isomerase
LKDYLWGGRALEALGRSLPAEGVVAESWEIAAHENGTTLVSNGRFAGQPLTAVHQQLGLDLIGRNSAWAQERGKFPLLVKLLDATLPLSVQVHPPDDYALAHEGNELGKTEMWVVLAAEPGAEIVLGVRAGTTKEAFRAALEGGDLDPLLHHLPIKAGDHICLPAGSLHALLGGALIAETLQNSDTTYRVYDWNRVGADGHPRPLHIDKALDVINFAQVEPALSPPQPLGEEAGVRRVLLCQNRYFTTERVTMDVATRFSGRLDGSTFEIWGALEGKVRVNEVELTAVQFCLLPAALGRYTITAETPATLLRTYVS